MPMLSRLHDWPPAGSIAPFRSSAHIDYVVCLLPSFELLVCQRWINLWFEFFHWKRLTNRHIKRIRIPTTISDIVVAIVL
jgi:hypothetical protein